MVELATESNNVCVSSWRCAVSDCVGELVVGIRDPSPRSKVFVRDLGVDFDALIDMSDTDGRLLSIWQRRVEGHGTEDVDGYCRDNPVCMVLSPFSCCYSNDFSVIPDSLDGAVESVGQTLGCKSFFKESDSET